MKAISALLARYLAAFLNASNRHAATGNTAPMASISITFCSVGARQEERGDAHEHETTDSRRLLGHCPWRRHRMGRALRHGPHKQGRRFRTCVAKQQPDHRHEHERAASASRDDESRERATLQPHRRIPSVRCRASRPPRNRPKAPSRAAR